MAYKRISGALFIVVFLEVFCPAVAQVPQFSATHYNAENIGLSHNTVLNMTTDKYGFVWISTMDGLNRFDGKSVKIFRHSPGDSTTLSDSFIHGLFEHSNGKYLVGTRDGGINILNPKTDQIERVNHSSSKSIPEAPVNVIFNDSKEFLWVGFFSNRIGNFNLEEKKYYPANLVEKGTGEQIFSVNSILELKDGSFLLSSLNGLFYVPGKEVEEFRVSPSSNEKMLATRLLFSKENPSPNTDNIFMDSDGDLWVRVVTGDLRKFQTDHLQDETLLSIKSGVARTSSKKYLERGDFLIKGHLEGTIKAIHKKTEEEKVLKVVDVNDVVGASTLYEDHLGNLWFYTWGGGFFRFEEKKGITLVTNREDRKVLPATFVLAFEDEEQGIWIGTSEGLAFVGDEQYSFPVPYEINEALGSIWSLERDDFGLWIATRTNGLFLITTESINNRKIELIQFSTQNSLLLSNNVHQVVKDSRGWLWLGYQGKGIQVIKNVKQWSEGEPASVLNLKQENSEISINSNSIRKIYEDKDGNIWLATTDNGFNYLSIEDESIVNVNFFEPGTELSHRDARSVFQQNDSTFWFASYGGGITSWKTASDELLNLRTPEGLSNNSVYGILGDENPEMIWMSTNNGIGRLNTRTLSFTNFTEADGLQNNEFNTGAYYKSTSGELYFGGVNGFNIINTKDLEVNKTPPKIYITGINLFNQALEIDSSAAFVNNLELEHNQNFLSFEFAALDYEEPTGNLYAYKMEGVDSDWVYSENRNFADYPNLEPGEYIFKVKAANTNGAWNEEAKSVHINILPPWWQTLWFRALYISLLALCSVLLIRYYSQRKLKEELRQLEIKNKLRNERERISRDLHDHVGAQLANIITGLALIDKYVEVDEREKSIKLMKSLKGDAEVTIKQLRETIWALNQNEINLKGFITHLNNYFKNQSALNEQLSLAINLQGNETEILSATQALNLFRIIQEASQNTLKYAKAERLEILFQRQNGSLEVSIKDDGNFIQGETNFNGGYGMKNMEKRAKEINGELKVTTEKGTEIKVLIPI
ncbi:MAG: hypothetical protein JJ971_03445 [Balneolaceae bacterium]|nr:hypothetical protein [Balneolaceae bacterium]MBO6545426.1 hypothetical protein [Balneolaceae bacterium]MBO6646822.1 hypothetical protein [Balneolaceae bacterium]